MKYYLIIAVLISLLSCSDDNDNPQPQSNISNPEFYIYERNGESSVDFSGQTIRILMAEELVSACKDFNSTETSLRELYRNESSSGTNVDPFQNPDLNTSIKSVREKVAASIDLFSANSSESAAIKNFIESLFFLLEIEVYPNKNQLASPGIAGQIADGSATRYIAPSGLEYDQIINKSLIGALMVDQVINNYISPTLLNQNNIRQDNNNKVLLDGTNYTQMEHLWDEAYGYLYGTSVNTANPNASIGADDNFLNKYIGRVNEDEDFTGIAEQIFNAFKIGRAAILANNYTLRDEQIAILRNEISNLIAIRAVYYMQQGKNALPADRNNYSAYGSAFHDLSEGYGFLYSLRFTRNGEGEELFSREEVDNLISKLLSDGSNGLWDVKAETLDEISEIISSKFNFTVAQAGE
ncbi:DUF4856 domain-containing protein [Hyphobacterium sp. CCMP332]|nr:DUF4856 domain-containing protein [Hyphobacterium sp. CCMP332]